MTKKGPVLVTGFEPYAGRGENPAATVTTALDGREVLGVPVVGRRLPVSFGKLSDVARLLLEELRPSIVICLGLWPGEPMIRLERLAVNIADFEIPDNEGILVADSELERGGAVALSATLPLRWIETSLLKEGIPVRISSTAGTFLCNCCLYSFLTAIAARKDNTLCGFIHLPYLPAQVAEFLQQLRDERQLELHQRADLASMELRTSIRAVQISIERTIQECL